MKTYPNYITPLKKYKFDLKAKKLEGLARLVKLNLPTVSSLYIVSTQAYQEYFRTKKLSQNLVSQLKKNFNKIRSRGESVTLRNAIYEQDNPAVAFALTNSPNLTDYQDFENKIIAGYRQVIETSFNPSKVEFSYLIQTFYSSEKCGTLLTTSRPGEMLLQAILGQHTNLIFRGDIEPDSYIINKTTHQIIDKHVAVKEFRLKKDTSGLVKVKVSQNDQLVSVLSDSQVIKISKLAIKTEKSYGPQQIDWAILDSGKIIFQETHDLEKVSNISFVEQGEIIYPAKVTGQVLHVQKITAHNQHKIKGKIVIISNLDIQFINQLLFTCHPQAVVLTKGSLTSHAATILRESKMTTILVRSFNLLDGDHITITKKGEIVHV